MGSMVEGRIPPGPYTVAWPDHQGGLFRVVGTGWAIPVVAWGVQDCMEALADVLNAMQDPDGISCPMCGGVGRLVDVTDVVTSGSFMLLPLSRE